MDKSIPDPPTAVLLHGILGSRKNWGTRAVLHRELVHFIYCYLYVLVVNHVTNKLLFSFFLVKDLLQRGWLRNSRCGRSLYVSF
jgi:hypothetical protein